MVAPNDEIIKPKDDNGARRKVPRQNVKRGNDVTRAALLEAAHREWLSPKRLFVDRASTTSIRPNPAKNGTFAGESPGRDAGVP